MRVILTLIFSYFFLSWRRSYLVYPIPKSLLYFQHAKAFHGELKNDLVWQLWSSIRIFLDYKSILSLLLQSAFGGFIFNIFIRIYYLYGGGVFIVNLYICVQCILVKFIPRSFSLIPFPSTTSTGFIVLFSYKCIKYINHIHPALSSPSHKYPPHNRTCFTFLSFIFFQVYIHCSEGVLPCYQLWYMSK
jgi:hypothetical protein